MQNNEDPKRFLYGWLIQYNPFKGNYEATNRDNYFKLFNGGDRTPIIESSKIETIETIIIRCEGKMEKLIKWKESIKEDLNGNNN